MGVKMKRVMEKKLYDFLQRRENKLPEIKEKAKKNGNNKNLISGTSNSDIGESSNISQLKMENQISTLSDKRKIEGREKSLLIARAFDGICPCCGKKPISVDLIKNLNLPLCKECGKKCTEIRDKRDLSIIDYLNLVIEEGKEKIDSYLASL